MYRLRFAALRYAQRLAKFITSAMIYQKGKYTAYDVISQTNVMTMYEIIYLAVYRGIVGGIEA